MTAVDGVPFSTVLEENLASASPDMLRAMVALFAGQLMGAEADALCGAEYGQSGEGRMNYRNGYRRRAWDTRAGTVGLAIPKLRQGTYFPEWLQERRSRAEQALISVVACGAQNQEFASWLIASSDVVRSGCDLIFAGQAAEEGLAVSL